MLDSDVNDIEESSEDDFFAFWKILWKMSGRSTVFLFLKKLKFLFKKKIRK